MQKKKSKSWCRVCKTERQREDFPLDRRGWLKGAVCKNCMPAIHRTSYAARGGYGHEQEVRCRYIKKYPWAATLRYINNRIKFSRQKAYLSKKNTLTVDELKFMWYRDGAGNMSAPSIDRIDPDGDYTFENCRYLELRENISRCRRERQYLT